MVVISAAIRPKRSETSGSRPQAGDILVGELATNLADKRIYSKTTAGDIIMVGDGGGVRTGSDGPDVPGFEDGENDGDTYVQIGGGSYTSLIADGGNDWVLNGDGYHFEDTTYRVLDGSNQSTTVISADSIPSTGWVSLNVEFTSNVGPDSGTVFAFGVWDYGDSSTSSGGGNQSQAGMLGAEHIVRFDFLSTDEIIITNDGFSTLVRNESVDVEGLHSWRLLYTGTNLSDLTLKVYKDYTLLFTETGIAVPTTSRAAFGASSGSTGANLSITDFQLDFYNESASTSDANAVARFWFWEEFNQQWLNLPASTEIGRADDVIQTIAPSNGDVLAYDTQRSLWVPTGIRENSLERQFQVVTGTVNVGESYWYQSLMFAGATPVANFLDGSEGVQVEIVNRSADGLSLTAANGVDLTTGGGLLYVRAGGAALAVYTNGKWTVSGDLYDISGAGVVFTLETAQDYEVPASKSDGDVIQYDSFLGKFTTGPVDTSLIETALQNTFQLGDLQNVNLIGVSNNDYLVYSSATGKWQNEPLPIAAITESVALGLSFDGLGDVDINSPQDGQLLAYNASSQVWENIPGGDIAGKSDKLATFRPVASNYTLLTTDSTKVVQVSGESLVTLPSNVDVGFQVLVVQNGTGEVTFSASAIYASGGRFSLREQYSVATCIHLGSGQWYVFGDLKATGAAQGAVVEYVGDLADVFADNAVNGDVLVYNSGAWLPEQPFVTLSTLKSLAADSTDFADFQARIAAL